MAPLLVVLFVAAAAAPEEEDTGRAGIESAAEMLDRFRPFLRFSRDEEVNPASPYGETIRPQRWQRLFTQSALVITGAIVLTPADIDAAPEKVLAYGDIRRTRFDCDCGSLDNMVLTLKASADVVGATWAEVAHEGAGLYGHVTRIPETRSYVVEYWLLYGYDRGSPGGHPYDLTSVTLIYDALADRLVQVNYPVHGCMLMSFTLPASAGALHETGEQWLLPGPDGPASVAVRRVEDAWYSHGGECRWGGFPDPLQEPADGFFYLAAGADGAFEHPVVFIENGGHENWPNPTGWLTRAPKHDGDDVSFMPDPTVVQLLDPTVNGSGPDDAFLFFGGRYGDPAGITRHHSWYVPDGARYLPLGAPCPSDSPEPYPWRHSHLRCGARFGRVHAGATRWCGWACTPECGDGP